MHSPPPSWVSKALIIIKSWGGFSQTALSAIDFLTLLKSSRIDEFKAACQSKFELSTVFKNSAELAVLSKQVLLGGMEDDGVP